MIYIYPSNRLENLILLLDQVMQVAPHANLLEPEQILVQSKGMQHWLHLQMAQQRGISMNLQFSMPVQFFWRLMRSILGPGEVPEHSPFSRQVMSWSLYQLLAEPTIINHPLCAEPTHYWQPAGVEDALRRYQLAEQIADLFEQYLIYRPDWILKWQGGETPHWQALLWQQLTALHPNHPVALMQRAIEVIHNGNPTLPSRISLFGINAMPPLWLDLLEALSHKTQVHLFHLNPCVEYWGDIQSERALAHQLGRWVVAGEAQPEAGNPLLANLGAQGREFLSLLQEKSQTEIPLFEAPAGEGAGEVPPSLLQQIQTDILQLEDARCTPHPLPMDESLVVYSAHSALREIQSLHDWLLRQMEQDPSLNPRDILVMCPQVEHYAPYIGAVFSRGWHEDDDGAGPRLPCSIADRIIKHAEPLIEAFSELLELPDSRFQISQVLSYLRLPALQQRFSIDDAELETLTQWLHHAAVHWGIDADHKQRIINHTTVGAHFSWQQGLRRLLLGFAYGDSEALYADTLLLPDVEGEQALLLGRLMQLLQQLQYHARQLSTPRTIPEWRDTLTQLREGLFCQLAEDQYGLQCIDTAIESLSEEAACAALEDKIPLTIIREYLNNQFSQPEPGRQFLAGQVTICSMIPMRSVPFRIIAVLGLNDGEFPRQRIPQGFDLMAQQPRRGDRSRRGDDRYLFLEALISARQALYLSYQGHDIKNNLAREPSLVLRELMEYLQGAYGWLNSNNTAPIQQVSMHPFSPGNYQGSERSYNPAWLRLVTPGEVRNNRITLPPAEPASVAAAIPLDELVRCFDNPLRSLAEQRLQLFLQDPRDLAPEDAEPFSSNHLDRYLIQQQLLESQLLGQDSDEILQRAQLSGRLPDTPTTPLELQQWQQQAGQFAATVVAQGAERLNPTPLTLSCGGVELSATLPLDDEGLLLWRLATPKPKDELRLWLYHLFANAACGRPITSRGLFRGDSKKPDQMSLIRFRAVEEPLQLLQPWVAMWQQAQQQPLLLHAQLGAQLGGKAGLTPLSLSACWQDSFQSRGLGADPYVRWFWPTEPDWEDELLAPLTSLYGPLYAAKEQELL